MRYLGKALFTMALLAAFTLGFGPSVAWAAGSPGGSVNEIVTGDRQLAADWTPTIPVGLTMRVPGEASLALAQAGAAPPAGGGGGYAPPPRRSNTGNTLWNVGKWMVIGGSIGVGVGIVLIIAGWASCAGTLTVGGCVAGGGIYWFGVAVIALSALALVAGSGVWIAGAVMRGNSRAYLPQPRDPWSEKALAKQVGDVPASNRLASYSFSF